MNDYDELNTHQTDPLNDDTDGDTIMDGSEWKIGLNPTNDSTHGVPDSEYSIEQNITSDSSVFALINTEDSPYDMSVRINTTGCAEDEMTVTESGYSRAIGNEMITGKSFDISMPEERTAETMRISFSIRDDQVGNKLNKYTNCEELCGIKRFNIFRFYEGVNMLLPIETEFDLENNVVYADTDETGTYCLIDMEAWFNELGIEPIRQRPQILANAPQRAYQKKRFNGHDYAKIDSGIITWQNAKLNCEKMGGHLATITSEAEQLFIESLIIDGQANNYWLGATDEVLENDWKWITDEPWNYEHWGENQPSDTAVYNIKGEDYLGITTVDSKWAVINDWNDYRPDDSVVKGYICEWENEDIEGTKYDAFIANRWKTITLDTPLSPDSDTDTDNDTLTDWNESKNEYLKLKEDGTYELPTFEQVFDMADIVFNWKRYKGTPYEVPVNNIWKRRVLPVNFDPTMMDSDGDEIPDNEDLEPLKIFLYDLMQNLELMEKYIDEYIPFYCVGAEITHSVNPINSIVTINILRNFGYGTDEIDWFESIKNNPKNWGIDLKDDTKQWLKWTITDGDYYTEFKNYVNSKNPLILNFLKNYKLYDKDGNGVDFLHMLATLGAERHNWIDPNLAGWAGDLQSLIRDLRFAKNSKKYNYENIDKNVYMLITGEIVVNKPKFPMPDLLADVDAKNISNSYNEDCRLSETFKDYYTYYTGQRFSNFVNNVGGYGELFYQTYDYTRGYDPVKHMILHHFAKLSGNKEVTLEESYALCIGFTSLIEDKLYEEAN